MKIVGIDPGKAGGIAVVDGTEVTAMPMPETAKDVLETFREIGTADWVVLEKVGAMPGDGGVAMFTFGKGVGHLEMALLACGLRFVEVTPAKWMGEMGMRKKGGESRPQFKNRLKGLAQQLYPTVKVTLKTADALLLAEWGRRVLVKS